MLNRLKSINWLFYLSFFEFYYYVLTGNKKQYNITPRAGARLNYLVILMTPLVLLVITMIIFGTTGSLLFRMLFLLSGAMLIINTIISGNKLRSSEFLRKVQAERERIEEKIKRIKMTEEKEAQRKSARLKYAEERAAMKVLRWFSILGIPPTKDKEIIRKAYRKKSKEYHPDLKGGNDAKFIELNEAYEIILKLID